MTFNIGIKIEKSFERVFFVIPEGSDILAEEADPKLQGLENFDTLMLSLGLSERKPIPPPISFPAPDPLGATFIGSNTRQEQPTAALGGKSQLQNVSYSKQVLCFP